MGNQESIIKNKGLIELSSGSGYTWRFWNHPTGEAVPVQAIKDIRARFIKYPALIDAIDRLPRIKFGFTGSPDTIGIVPVKITPEMVGNTIGVFVGVEFKTDTGRQSKEQKQFQVTLNEIGGVYVVERNHVGIVDRVRAAVMASISAANK